MVRCGSLLIVIVRSQVHLRTPPGGENENEWHLNIGNLNINAITNIPILLDSREKTL